MDDHKHKAKIIPFYSIFLIAWCLETDHLLMESNYEARQNSLVCHLILCPKVATKQSKFEYSSNSTKHQYLPDSKK